MAKRPAISATGAMRSRALDAESTRLLQDVLNKLEEICAMLREHLGDRREASLQRDQPWNGDPDA